VTSLETRLRAGEPVTLGEVTVLLERTGAEIHGPSAGGEPTEVGGGIEALREWVRFDDRGSHRPLSGARTLRHDWLFRCAAPALPAALDVIYPLATLHREMASAGRLRIVSLDEVLARQTRAGSGARAAPPAVQSALVRSVCAICVRSPAWYARTEERAPVVGEIPCPEPCSVSIALCRAALAWEANSPPSNSSDPSVPFAEFENPRNALRAAYLQARKGGGTNDGAAASSES